MEFEFELENIHVVILCVTAVAIIIADHDAIAYLRGKKPLLDVQRVKRLHYIVTAGLIGMVLTGVGLFYDEWGELIDNSAFYLKMFFVLALIINGVLISTLMPLASRTPFIELSSADRTKLLVSGAISGISWVGAATIGLFFL